MLGNGEKSSQTLTVIVPRMKEIRHDLVQGAKITQHTKKIRPDYSRILEMVIK
jgi:hypothetical protein